MIVKKQVVQKLLNSVYQDNISYHMCYQKEFIIRSNIMIINSNRSTFPLSSI